MKKKKNINSHVTIPKSILEKFAYVDEKENHIVKYIDLNTLEIKKEKTSRFNTRLGYYSKKIEKILSDEAESKIGNVIKKLQEIDENTTITEKDINSIYKFLAYQVIRTDSFSERLKKEFQIPLDNKAIKNAFINEELDLNIIYNIVKNTDVYIIINVSNSKFVLPANLMYTFNPDSDEYKWVQVLSPNIALVFIKKGTIRKIHNNEYKENVKIVKFTKEQVDIINGFNIRALGVQLKDKTEMKYIVGLDNELKYLVDIMIKNKE